MFPRLTLVTLAIITIAMAITAPASAAGKDLSLVPTTGPLAHQKVYADSYALLIGVNKYANLPAQLQLHFAASDANAMRDVLIRNYGFPADHIRMLLNQDATKENITAALSDFADGQTYHTDDRVLVFFSGHGQTINLPGGGEMGFLIPSDAKVQLDHIDNAAPFLRSCIEMEAVWNYLQSTPAKHVLLIADACYSGLLTQSRALGMSPGALASMASRRALQVMTAGGKGQTSEELDQYGHGAFTYKLLEELKARATTVGDVFTSSELYAAVERLVSNLTDGGQDPQFGNYKTEGNFLFITTKPQTVRAIPDERVGATPPHVAEPPTNNTDVDTFDGPAPTVVHTAPQRPSTTAPVHRDKPKPPAKKPFNPKAMQDLFLAIQNGGGSGTESNPTTDAAVRQAQQALDDGADVNGIFEGDKQTPLIASLSYECLPMVRFLIAHGANVNKADPSGETPMSMSKMLSGFAKDVLVAAGAHE